MPESPVLETARRYQAQLARAEQQATKRLIDSYLRSWERLDGMLAKLLLDIGDQAITRGQLVRKERYKALMRQIENELAGLQALTGNEIQASGALITLGERSARELMAMSIGRAEAATAFNVLPRAAIQTLLGFLDPGGPLFDRLRSLTAVNAQFVADAMVEGITLGFNPRKIARMVRDAFGRGLSDALRFVRTAQLWSYREANRASMVANQDILDGWVWYAKFDERTCMSCVVMHGTVHPIDEALNDHHNGRCTAIPLVVGFDNPVTETGIEWFEKQSEAAQQKMMGREFWNAWQGGAFNLSEMSSTRRDEVYGDMRVEARLWQLLGAEPPVRIPSEGLHHGRPGIDFPRSF